ncbi:MAG TPA: family 1 encapsulin nanocompartment shell protein [Solirubrobacter sp.]|nr:family 1 encapsulin nanocompartment shell protein [Solirubrobacter sp.]
MNHLLRDVAPVTEAAWAELDQEARERLEPALAARKVVDFSGGHGWEHSATNLGRTQELFQAPAEGVRAAQRRVLPVIELRVDFAIARAELRDLERGAADVDLDALAEAARRIALAENVAVFHGWHEAGIQGIAEACTHDAVALTEDFDEYATHTAEAVETLLKNGISGPYALALGPDQYTGVIQSTEHGGFPLFDHLKKILAGGPIVWAPGVRGAVVVSLRGGDFLFESGQDLSIGYDRHDADAVYLYLEESFTFRVATPEAACSLEPAT